MDLRVQTFEEVSSTNNLVKAAIDDGDVEGLVIRALRQNAGYGRQGRGWRSPEGGLYCSWLLRPNVPSAHLSTLSLVVGLAVQAACQDCVSTLGGIFESKTIAVKWPNDVVVVTEGESGFKKLCGISTEAYHGGICEGIGINVFPPAASHEGTASGSVHAAELGASNDTGRIPFHLSSFRRPNDVSVFEELTHMQALDQVFESLAAHLVPAYERWCQEGFAPFVEAFNAYNILTGQFVELVSNSGAVLQQGTVQGVNNDGTLRLLQPDGSEIAASSGEAHVLFK